jgi:hypothetical protein
MDEDEDQTALWVLVGLLIVIFVLALFVIGFVIHKEVKPNRSDSRPNANRRDYEPNSNRRSSQATASWSEEELSSKERERRERQEDWELAKGNDRGDAIVHHSVDLSVEKPQKQREPVYIRFI